MHAERSVLGNSLLKGFDSLCMAQALSTHHLEVWGGAEVNRLRRVAY